MVDKCSYIGIVGETIRIKLMDCTHMRDIGIRVALVLIGVSSVAACSPVPGNFPLAPLEPPAQSYSDRLPDYRIQVGDVLSVRLLLNPELNENVTVRPDGHISTTIAKDVPAAGLTIPELSKSLLAIYA